MYISRHTYHSLDSNQQSMSDRERCREGGREQERRGGPLFALIVSLFLTFLLILAALVSQCYTYIKALDARVVVLEKHQEEWIIEREQWKKKIEEGKEQGKLE